MRRTCVSRKITRCTKVRGAQRSPELALRSTDFRAPENLIFPALVPEIWSAEFFCILDYLLPF